MLLNTLKAFVQIERNHKSDVFIRKSFFFVHACATSSEVPSNLSNMEIFKANTAENKKGNRKQKKSIN